MHLATNGLELIYVSSEARVTKMGPLQQNQSHSSESHTLSLKNKN